MKALKPGITNASPFRLLTWTILLLFIASTLGCHIFRKRKGHRYRLRGVHSPVGFMGFSQAKKRSSPSYYYSNSSTFNVTKTRAKAGVLTSGELSDFGKWDLWEDLTKTTLSRHADTWKLAPQERYTVQVTNEHAKPMVDLAVQLLDADGKVIWQARTDNTGKAELWANSIKTKPLEDLVKNITVSHLGIQYNLDDPVSFQNGINMVQIVAACDISNKLDIAFMVDATSSMSDEIKYLKAELKDIAQKITTQHGDLDLAMASIFYRCLGNEYVTRRSDFSADIDQTINFIEKQSADEGGQEAVEIALEEAVNELKWREDARARLLFIILDEAPGEDSAIIAKLHSSLLKAAEKGIRIIPVVASGVFYYNQDKSLEYLMRCMALATNGTYVFLTNHSGVGGNHAEPSTDEYDVELLNDLITRLIHQFTYVPSCTIDSLAKSQEDTVYVYNKKVIEHVVLKEKVEPGLEAQEEVVNDDTATVNSTLAPVELEVAVEVEAELESGDDQAGAETDEYDQPDEPLWKSFKLYPNPTSGILFAEIDGELSELYIADITGKLLRRIPVDHQNRVKIDLTDLPSGIYLIQGKYDNEWLSGKVMLVR